MTALGTVLRKPGLNPRDESFEDPLLAVISIPIRTVPVNSVGNIICQHRLIN